MKDTIKQNLFRRFNEYLLLNASFTNNIGICNGKSALVLLLHYLDTGRGFSFMEEIIDQINEYSPHSYGSGIAGFGVVLEHLVQSDFIDEDANEILEDCEKSIYNDVYSNSLVDVSVANGISGTGFFMLHRLRTKYPGRNALFFNHRLNEGIARCVFAIERQFVAWRLENGELPVDQSLWGGPCGSLLFLTAVADRGIPAQRLPLITQEIIRYVTVQLSVAKFSWLQIDSWFVALHAARQLEDKTLYFSLTSSFKKVLQVAASKLETVDLNHCAFTALLLHLIYKKDGLVPALHLSDNLLKVVSKVLDNNALSTIFPFQQGADGVNIGLDGGVCGTALPLWSLETKDFAWMSILGLHY